MRRWKLLIPVVFFLCIHSLQSQEVSDLFAALDSHYREHPPSFPLNLTSLISIIVSQEYPGGVRVHYFDPQTVVIDSSLGGSFGMNGKFFNAFESGNLDPTTRILKTRIDSNSEDKYIIDFTLGPSWDPHFIVHRVDGYSTAFMGKTGFCNNLFIPGDGFIYTTGHVNSMFDIRRRYAIQDDHLVETPQPFYRVGLETVTTGPLKLLSDPMSATILKILPAGTSITVLLNKDDLYLITTPFGLTGWAVIESPYYTPIQHLIFRGD